VSDDTNEFGLAIGVAPAQDQNGNWHLATTIAHGAVTAVIAIPLGREEEFIGELKRMLLTQARAARRMQRGLVVGKDGE
jgi:hypothetical protein